MAGNSSSGRKTDEFKAKCRRLADSPLFFKWAKDVIEGRQYETRVTKDGDVVDVPVSIHDRKELWKDLAAYGHGKPLQGVEHSGAMDIGLKGVADAIRKASVERGLPV